MMMGPDQIQLVLETSYTDGIETVLSSAPSGNGYTGQFLDRGTVFDYTISDDGDIEYQENRSDSDYIAEYFVGRLDAAGIRCDSNNPYEYYKGRFDGDRMDAFKGKPKCKNGTVPCGNRCLPKGQVCRSKVGSPGSGKFSRKKGAAIAGGVVAAGAAAALAAAALRNRQKRLPGDMATQRMLREPKKMLRGS